jgi:hypothetical protein
MEIKYNAIIEDKSVSNNLKRLTNLIYKLLPSREEDLDWEKPLETIIEEFAGMSRLLIDQNDALFSLLCKLEGLFTLTNEEDFLLFRRTIFECLSLCNTIKQSCQED